MQHKEIMAKVLRPEKFDQVLTINKHLRMSSTADSFEGVLYALFII
jgi:hypothetical protein